MQKNKFKKIIVALSVILILSLAVFIVYPHIEFRKNGKLYVCSFSDDFSEFEENASYNELYFYNEKRDISIKTFDIKNFLCFYLFHSETFLTLNQNVLKQFLSFSHFYLCLRSLSYAKTFLNKTFQD